MEPVKVSMPQSGAPKTGLVQFGDELPGIYITADDAFALKLDIDDFERFCNGELPSVSDDSTISEVVTACDQIHGIVEEFTQQIGKLRKIVALTPFGSIAHLMRQRATPLAATKKAA